VLTLCGVLKDILLVTASVIIWGTTVTVLQFFGYGLALFGLIHYKLGTEVIKQRLKEFRQRSDEKPTLKFGFVVIMFIWSLGCFTFLAGPPSAIFDRRVVT
jgi:hypothetical protein